jgi:alpha-glucosidase
VAPDAERFARYLRPDELHTAFNFSFLSCPWDADRLRTSIDETLAEHAPVGAPATWVLCNHDVTRTVTRYGREDTGFDFATKAFGTPTDLALGHPARPGRRPALARPARCRLPLPGRGTRPARGGHPPGAHPGPDALPLRRHRPGRDGCRVPLPWAADAPYAGFGSRAEPWLPQPAGWTRYAAGRQAGDPGSMLRLYREALRIRRTTPGFGEGPLSWLSAPDGVLAFARTDGLVCVVNLVRRAGRTARAHPAPAAQRPPGRHGAAPGDTAVWLRV